MSQREHESDDVRSKLEAKVTDELGRMSAEMERLRRLLTLAGDDYSRLQRSSEDLESRHRVATQQLEVLSRVVQQKDAEIKSLSTNLDEKREAWLQDERQKSWEQIRLVNTQKNAEVLSIVNKKEGELVATSEKHNQEIMKIRHENTVTVAKLHDEGRRLREQNEGLSQNLEMIRIKGEKDLQNFRKQLEAKQWELEKSAGEMRSIIERIERLEAEHQNVVVAYEDTKQRLAAASTQLAATENQLADSGRWTDHLNAEISKFEASPNMVEQLRKDLAELTLRYQKQSREKDEAQQETMLLKDQLLKINESRLKRASSRSGDSSEELTGRVFRAPTF